MNQSKKILAIVVSMFAGSTLVNAQTCTELYKTANSVRLNADASYNKKDVDKSNQLYQQAISLYSRAKGCDTHLTNDCNSWIKYCRKHIVKPAPTPGPYLNLDQQEIRIPFQGGDQRIEVMANGKWAIEGATEWCKADASSKNFVVQCRDVNNSTREKETTLIVKSGTLYKSLKVVQEGRPEYLEVGATSMSFPAEGTEDDITIDTNVNWDISSVPSWCEVVMREDGLHITVFPNNRTVERVDDIIVRTPNESVTIHLRQGAGQEHLTLSQNDLTFNSEGDEQIIRVYTDAENWFIGDFPTWLTATRVDDSHISIKCGKNLPNGEPRVGSVQVKTDCQTVGVMITQSPRYYADIITPGSTRVGGRNLSFGVSASYYAPFVQASAGGDYVGSVVDYGLGTSEENANYKSMVGYSFGLFADIRLYHNFFLTAGVNFTQYSYKNTFNRNTFFTAPLSDYQVLKGEVQNNYTESYNHTMVEVPILASYRFKTGLMSHVQLGAGPVLNFGLKSNMKFSGNTSSSTLHAYSANPPYNQLSTGNYDRHTAASADFNLYQPCVLWEESFTLGNDAAVGHHDVFRCAPLSKVNCGLRLHAAYEWAGISFGLSYTHMLTNMAQKDYWETDHRMTVLNASEHTMKGYSYRINNLEVRLAYTLRYKNKKEKK